MYSNKFSQVSGAQRDAAKGAELLLTATFLHHYCLDVKQDADTAALEVTAITQRLV
jgi:DNA polymerase phi